MDDGRFKLYRSMVKPLKKLNVDDMVEEIKNAEGSSKYEELEVDSHHFIWMNIS